MADELDQPKLRAWWALLVPLLAPPALWPLFASGLPRASDTALHLARLELLHEHILAGTLWPRWLPELTLGYGYLFFTYYAPATYYVAELFHLLGFSTVRALQLLSALLIVGAGVSMFFFAREQFTARGRVPALTATAAALVAAAAAIYNPYLLTNVYLRGAFGEAGAMALMPLILLAVRRIFYRAEPQRPTIVLAFALAALALTHTLSLLFAPAVIAGYVLVLWAAGGRDRRRLAWAGAGIVLAMALSTAFWLPLLLQRDLVTSAGTELARDVRLPAGMWTWGNFLDTGLRYTYTFIRPVRLGLLQFVLGVAGFLLARRRDGEWLYLGAVALVAGLLIGEWALPLWQNSPLAVAQFAWRLLGVATLPLALFAGGCVLGAGPRPRTAGLLSALIAAVLIGLTIFAQRPRLDWLDVFAPGAVPDDASIAQLEVRKGVGSGGAQNSNVQEFRPAGAPAELELAAQPPTPALHAAPAAITVTASSGYVTELRISSPATATVRLANFYHPFWRATLDGGAAPPPYPSTSLSLLTLDVPPGAHSLRVRWTPPATELAAAAVTLATLAGLGLWAARRRRTWPLAGMAGALLLLGVLGVSSPPPRTVGAPAAPVADHGLRLAGVAVDADDPAQVVVHPWWQVTAPPPAGLQVRWLVKRAHNQEIVGESVGVPWFNTADASLWPVGNLVDDAYTLPLRAGLEAGVYDLAVELLGPGDPPAPPGQLPTVARFTLSGAVPPDPVPQHPTIARMGDWIQLVGYDLVGAETRDQVSAPALKAGDELTLVLYWRTDRALPADYRTFAHLFDAQGNGLVKEDQTPGPEFHPTAAWLPGRTYTDRFLLRIPDAAPGGLYAPWVGMVDAAGERLPVSIPGAPLADEVRLPPVKVVQRNAGNPAVPLASRFGDLARLGGYDLEAPSPLRAGDAFTVTLHLDAVSSTGAPYIRFLQLVGADGAIVAQHDGPPARINPTESWLPGERILDTVGLTVDPAAAPGVYTLIAGFYEFGNPAARVPVTDAEGNALENSAMELGQVEIAP